MELFDWQEISDKFRDSMLKKETGERGEGVGAPKDEDASDAVHVLLRERIEQEHLHKAQ